jgi:Na+-driven multidrug efflux pump
LIDSARALEAANGQAGAAALSIGLNDPSTVASVSFLTFSISQLAFGILLGAAAASAVFLGLVLGNRQVLDARRRVPNAAIWLITAILFVSVVVLFSVYRPDLLFDITVSALWFVLFVVVSFCVLYALHPAFRRRKQ